MELVKKLLNLNYEIMDFFGVAQQVRLTYITGTTSHLGSWPSPTGPICS